MIEFHRGENLRAGWTEEHRLSARCPVVFIKVEQCKGGS